jgi:hypothetical protein
MRPSPFLRRAGIEPNLARFNIYVPQLELEDLDRCAPAGDVRKRVGREFQIVPQRLPSELALRSFGPNPCGAFHASSLRDEAHGGAQSVDTSQPSELPGSLRRAPTSRRHRRLIDPTTGAAASNITGHSPVRRPQPGSVPAYAPRGTIRSSPASTSRSLRGVVAGFQVSINGRFWVSTDEPCPGSDQRRSPTASLAA